MGNIYNPEEECHKVVSLIFRICERRGISRYALAMKAGVSESTIHSLANNKTSPYLHTVFKLCNALDLTIDELLSDEAPDDHGGTRYSLSAEEKQLLHQYRNLSEKKQILLQTLVDMVEQYHLT